VYAWPRVIHRVVISGIQAATHRPVSIEAVEVNPFTGRLTVRGLRLFEPDGTALFTDFERLDAAVRPLALLLGHVSFREIVLQGSTVRVVRFADRFNFSDLVSTSSSKPGQPPDVTVDRLVITRGTVTLEDRALAEPRTWTSEQIEIEGRNLSTRRTDGVAMASSVTAGAPMSLEMRHLRLYPIHLEAVVKTTGFDLSLARVYAPSDAAVSIERGTADTTLQVVLDARVARPPRPRARCAISRW